MFHGILFYETPTNRTEDHRWWGEICELVFQVYGRICPPTDPHKRCSTVHSPKLSHYNYDSRVSLQS